MTCNHVVPDVATARRCAVEFDYVAATGDTFSRIEAFKLEPARTFATAQVLDYTIVAVQEVNAAGDVLSGRSFIRPDPRPGKLIVGEEVNMLHHPLGEPLQLLVRGNVVRDIIDSFILFQGGTLPGSAGAPLLNDQWDLVGLHHARKPVGDGSDEKLCEAIRMSSILTYLLSAGEGGVLTQLLSPAEEAIAALPDDPPAAASAPRVPARAQPAASPADARPDTFDTKLTPTRDTVFLCYARADQGENRWKDRLDRQLGGITRCKSFSVWNDRRIAAGTDWKAEIELALQRCGAAVLLIGPSFLDSDFIQSEELPKLLRAHEDHGVPIYPLITDYCPYRHSPLGRFQSVNDPKAPLESLPAAAQNRLLLDIAEHVAAAFEDSGSGG